MKDAYLLAGTRLGVLFKLILSNGISLRLRYIFRMLFLLQGSFWSSLLAWLDNRQNSTRLKHAPVPKNPIIIIGHWRTGSTFLHQLLSLDPSLAAPTLFHCTYPDSFLSSRKYVQPILGLFVKGTRPIDNVKIDIDAPQEDEFALFRMTGHSPLKRLVFPHSEPYFLLDDETFLPPEPACAEWEDALISFVTRLQLQAGRRPVLKNPFHSMRMAHLRKLFPDARFIHIYRNPEVVIPSTVQMWSIVGSQNTMRKEWRPPSFDDVITVFDRVLRNIRKALLELPQEHYAEIRFEDFEKDPSAVLKEIYTHLGLDFSDAFKSGVDDFLKENADYKKNTYILEEHQKELIRTRLKTHMATGRY